MANSTHLNLPYISSAQAQKHVTHNEAIRALDAVVQLAVLDRNLATPPVSPVAGARYLVAAAATGAWSGHTGKIAAFQDGTWAIYPPVEGWLAWINDEDILVTWTGTGWVNAISAAGLEALPKLGINATADLTNRLAVTSPASLFNHEGAGHQIKINKSAAASTASILYQTAFSGRAEFGTTGDDNFHVKVSANGTVWNEAITIDRTTGAVTLPLSNFPPAGAGARSVQVFAASGTWTRPAGIRKLLVEVIGGGGGGGGVTGVAAAVGAGGGGGGGGSARELLDVSATASVVVTVGAGGIAGALTGGVGGTGGTTLFGALCSATGGAGGAGMVAAATLLIANGGAPGSGTGGTTNAQGSAGGIGLRLSGTIGVAGSGGCSVLGGGPLGVAVAGNGANGVTPGSGGGGAFSNAAVARTGGVGANGYIIVWEFE
jgi:Protein of unknown function (DUF2793)